MTPPIGPKKREYPIYPIKAPPPNEYPNSLPNSSSVLPPAPPDNFPITHPIAKATAAYIAAVPNKLSQPPTPLGRSTKFEKKSKRKF